MYLKKNLKKVTVKKDVNLRDSLANLNNGGIQALLVINEDDTFAGIVTDGDIRRHLLKDGNLDTSIGSILTKDSIIAKSEDQNELNKIFKNYRNLKMIRRNAKNTAKLYTWNKRAQKIIEFTKLT